MDGEALAGIADGGRGDFGKRHRAEFRQRGNPGIGRGRHHGSQKPDGNASAVAVAKQLEARRLRPVSETGDAEHLAALGGIDQHRGHAGELDLVAVDHAERDPRRDAGIDRIAAGLQHGRARLGRQIVARNAHMAPRRDHGLLRQDRHGRHSTLPVSPAYIEAGSPAVRGRAGAPEPGDGAAGET